MLGHKTSLGRFRKIKIRQSRLLPVPRSPWQATADPTSSGDPPTLAVTKDTCVLLGVFLNISIPTFFELFVETVYPVPEGITCGVVTFLSNMFMGVLLFFLTFYHTGKKFDSSFTI